jgi:ubiquitin carboxyl-terminal hydrolase L5
MEDSSGWCTIESDPGVFTELVEELGVEGVEFQEVFSLDDSSMAQLGTVHGLIFLFKYREGLQPRNTLPVTPEGLFYAKQVINNACATQAILSILLNLDSVNLGETLSVFKQFTDGLDEESRGYAVGSSEKIRATHNSFRPNASLEISQDEDKKKGDAFHFVSYVWHRGTVYELDGLQRGPVVVGACESPNSWVSVATPYIQSRIAEYTAAGDDEIRFNLMAVVDDQRAALRNQIETVRSTSNPTDSLLHELESKLDEIESRRTRWTRENRRRRHDFIPLALACLEVLAEKGKLVTLFTEARTAAIAEHETRKQK